MGYHISKPSFPLSLFVKQYWAIEDCVPDGGEHTQPVIPNGLIELMFYLGNRPKFVGDNKNLAENSILSGQQKGYSDLIVSGKLSMFSITFQPFGTNFFFNIPSNEFLDQNIPLKYIVKNVVLELESNLFKASSFEGKICIANRFLQSLLKRNYQDYDFKRSNQSVYLINRNEGAMSIDALSAAACLSRKQFERTFLNYIGTSPKQFLRTVRFQNTLFEKQKDKNISLTGLAYNCGYYDQSHMINDYKIFSGKTPTEYFSECEPYSDYFV